MKVFLPLFLLLFLSTQAISTIVEEKIYINRGLMVMVDSTSLPALAFNRAAKFDQKNAFIHIEKSDSLLLTIINNDTSGHDIALTIEGWQAKHILPGDSITLDIFSIEEGIYFLLDSSSYPVNAYMGLITTLNVSDKKYAHNFFWHLKEHQSSWNITLQNGQLVNWGEFDPDYFTINGISNPQVQNDPDIALKAKVGDTVIIFISNTGRGVHSLHFHGFHSTIVHDTQNNIRKKWSKDTFPLHPMHGLILMMVPDKPGFYPVHDHNLIATTGGGRYPNGIFLLMEIEE